MRELESGCSEKHVNFGARWSIYLVARLFLEG